MTAQREEIVGLINQAVNSGARQKLACEVIGMGTRTLQRWLLPDNKEDGRLTAIHNPANKLSELECQRIIKVANDPDYASLSPSKMVPRLADQDQYIGSESTIYRVLKAKNNWLIDKNQVL